MSFTNVAWQEIEDNISTRFGIQRPMSYPHFLGTIDSFINRFIFLPFGHLVMGCNKRPILVGPPFGTWSGRYFAESLFDNVSYDVGGNLYALNKNIMPSNWHNNRHIVNTKTRLNKAGYATQADANYYAMRVLEKFDCVAISLANRFPMVIIDEAQDTSEIQMRIIDSLVRNGLDEVALIGDPDQAIFEWHQAKPQLFTAKYEEWLDNSIQFNENRRSSQKICNLTFHLSSLEETSAAVNDEVKNHEFTPEIITYDEQTIDDTIECFLQLCSKNGIQPHPDNVAILCRSKSLFSAITGITPIEYGNLPWVDGDFCTPDLAKGKYLYDNGEYKTGVKIIEKAIIKQVKKINYCSEDDLREVYQKYGFIKFRYFVHDLIELLPKTNCCIGEWVQIVNRNFHGKYTVELKIKQSKGQYTFDELFTHNEKRLLLEQYLLGTVHSVKGETFEAVLLILKQKGIGRYYRTLLNSGTRVDENEEIRIVYVGLTRPRKLLVLAVPNETDKQAWMTRLTP